MVIESCYVPLFSTFMPGFECTFPEMFPDSEVAKKFQSSKNKIGYYITFGTAPHFRSLLLQVIRNSPFFAVMFGESLNFKKNKWMFKYDIGTTPLV